ncbi:cutinase family protein [Nocardia yamanashiensis]|uniref:cutinase family protein n=1 Tax=Nocardia yamanashiensis TaxID=209247 RepID=UPI00157DABD3|nr:cutinase family protein [Nocardia yamanashiensis]
MRTRKIIAALSAIAATLTGAVLAGSGPAAAETGCPGLYVVAIPGTWENNGSTVGPSMLSYVTDGLPGTVRTDYVSYPATVFPWEGQVYGRSKSVAINSARGMIASMAVRCAGTRVALLGYSQGADAAGDLAAELGTGAGVIAPNRVAAVGLISDPRRAPTDILVGPAVAGAGAGGGRPGGFGFISDRVRTICAIGDLYCSTVPEDFVTRFAGLMAQVSEASITDVTLYQQQADAIMKDLMAGGGISVLQQQFSPEANAHRQATFEQFYNSQVHTAYAGYDVGGASATAWLHDWLAGLA